MPRLSRVAIVAGAAAGAVAFVTMFEKAQTSKATSTPMTQSLDNRHSSAGGGGSNTPSVATKLGSEEDRAGGAEKDKGFGTKYFDDRHSDQKPSGDKKHT